MLLKLSGNRIGEAGQFKAIQVQFKAGQGNAKADSGQFSQIRISTLGKGLCSRTRMFAGQI